MPNRFEQVDEAVDDAVNVVLEKRDDGVWGHVACSRNAHPNLTEDKIGESLPPPDALSAAVKLANEFHLEIVVVDPDGVWKPEWGTLFRDEAA